MDPRDFEAKPSTIETLKKSKIDRQRLIDALEFARDVGLSAIEVDGIRMDVPPIPEEPLPPGDIKQPETPYDNLTDEEILFWSTPHFDELAEAKEEHMKALEEEGYVRENR